VVDGLIVCSGSIDHLAGAEAIKSFTKKYHPLPLVGISIEIEDATSVLVDNRSGMRELLVHLIERHGYRRFGFLTGSMGNKDAEDRFRMFQEVMKEYRISVDPQLIFRGDFSFLSGIEAARQVIKGGISKIDVLVASNDNMAMGAMDEFDRRGVRLPSEIAVTGFDNIGFGEYLSPPLTTVRLPIYEMGWTAAKYLIEKMEHKNAPSKVAIPTKLIIRESCRCLAGLQPSKGPAIENTADLAHPAKDSREAAFLHLREMTKSILVSQTNLDPENAASKMKDAFWEGHSQNIPEKFLAAFQETVYAPLSNSIDFFTYRNMLSELWNHRSVTSKDHNDLALGEDLLFQALTQMGQKIVKRETDSLIEFLHEYQKLEVIRELLFTMNINTQMDVLARRIPDLGIESCYVSLYKPNLEGEAGNSTCLLGIRDKKRIALGPNGIEFPSKRLVPDDFLSARGRHIVIVEAMKQFGFIVCETGGQSNRLLSYLTDIIGGAVHGALLYKALEEKKNDQEQNLDHIRRAMAGFIQMMSLTVETRDPYTAGHQRRVSDLARTIAQEMGMPAAQVDGIRLAGTIHDLGKIYVPAEILNRAGILDDIEWSMIKKHPKVAWDILKNVDFPWPIAEIVVQHHERINGKGYPNGLKGKAIRLESRILAVADVVEAMSSHRPYREALGIEKALNEINQNKGILYDPIVVDACTNLFRNKGYTFKTK
jgi:HD-GYP domain-containing protein (c-di-GMP phosphodiesterase class II)/ABC-type sugar transport system substrate-binding protein